MWAFRVAFSALALAALPWHAAGEAFLGQHGRGHHDLDAELQAALASVMGCGAAAGESPHDHVDAVKLTLTPMWNTLPKNQWGQVDWRMLRYAAHRYFMQQSSLLVKGFEPTRRVNSSSLGSAEILSKSEGEAVVDALLRGKVDGRGFSLDDVAFMVATLERVMHDTEAVRLESAYEVLQKKTSNQLSAKELADVLEVYMMFWMIEDDEETVRTLVKNRRLTFHVFPLWQQVRDFVAGVVSARNFEASRTFQAGQGRVAMQQTYSFEDAHQAVGHITKTFASFWEEECQNIKTSLVAMDKFGTGRVAISEFYGANVDGEWRFGESEAYLRELGALDETSPRLGNQVIISNYLQGASNCIVSTSYYLVCCVNECEDILNSVESAVGAPVASVDAILGLVRGMSNLDDEPPALSGSLTSQLHRIATTHGGHVPLHGRLFAQWLHYVFPRECPYPHKAGAASSASVMEYGKESFASDEELRAHSAKRNITGGANISDVEEAQLMSQWSEEEELAGAQFNFGAAPWEQTGSLFGYGCSAAALLGLAVSMTKGAWRALSTVGQPVSPAEYKSHFV